jgi:glutathione S-transferase
MAANPLGCAAVPSHREGAGLGTASRGYTLYWEKLSGAIAPQAMLEEMDVPYRKVSVDMEAGEHRGPAYLALNPTGQVPALGLPDGAVIGESAAMVLVLGERHPAPGLVPAPGDNDRPAFLRWLLFMAASVYMTFVRSNHPERFTTDERGTEPVRLAALRDIDRYFQVLDQAITGDPYLLGRGFSALDIYLAMLVVWHPDREDLFRRLPRIGALCLAVEQREAYARVIAEHHSV